MPLVCHKCQRTYDSQAGLDAHAMAYGPASCKPALVSFAPRSGPRAPKVHAAASSDGSTASTIVLPSVVPQQALPFHAHMHSARGTGMGHSKLLAIAHTEGVHGASLLAAFAPAGTGEKVRPPPKGGRPQPRASSSASQPRPRARAGYVHKRMFGFQCVGSDEVPTCRRFWRSAWATVDYKMGCLKCKTYVHPTEIWVYVKEGELQDAGKPHLRHLCEACALNVCKARGGMYHGMQDGYAIMRGKEDRVVEEEQY